MIIGLFLEKMLVFNSNVKRILNLLIIFDVFCMLNIVYSYDINGDVLISFIIVLVLNLKNFMFFIYNKIMVIGVKLRYVSCLCENFL